MENRQSRRYGLHLFADTIENFKSALPHGSHIVHSRTEGDSVYVNLETSMTRSELLNFVHSLPDSEATLQELFLLLNAMERIRIEPKA